MAVGGVLALVLIAAGVVYAVQFFTPHKETPATAKVALTSPSAAPASGGVEGKWSIGSGSEAGYRAKEKFLELSGPTDAVARTTGVTGSMTITSTGGQLAAQGLSVTADLTGLQSTDANAIHGSFQRDRFVGPNVLETGQFPSAKYESDPISIPAAATTGGQQQLTSHGKLTIHGTTKTVDIPVMVQVNGDRIEVVGSVAIDMRDYGIGVPDVGFTSVQPQATIEFHLFFSRA